MIKKIFDSTSDRYLFRLFLLGISFMSCALYLLLPMFTFKSQLIEIKGVLQSADTYVTTVTGNSRLSKSQKSEIIFYIFEKEQKFSLAKNIGDEYRNEEYQAILNGLRQADSVSVWIKKSEAALYEPKVFQIDVDNKTILQFERVRTENGGWFVLLFLIGLAMMIFYFSRLYPEKSKKLFRTIWPED